MCIQNIVNVSQHTGVESDDSSDDEVLKLMNENVSILSYYAIFILKSRQIFLSIHNTYNIIYYYMYKAVKC